MREESYIYTRKKPRKAAVEWVNEGDYYLYLSNKTFQFIQWEDENPYNIQELIEEYEKSSLERKVKEVFEKNPYAAFVEFETLRNESEETEVKKDLNWLREQIKNEMDSWVGENSVYFIGAEDAYEDVKDWLNQLDEPETLSKEWLDENKSSWTRLKIDGYYIPVEKLQNLLVPKQELPVIPKYIADWIEGYNRKLAKWKLPSTFRSDVKYKADQRLYEWANKKGNMNIFMKAILLGYEVEEEPKYRARLKVITDEFIASYLRTQSSNAEDRLKALEIGSKYIHEDYRHLSEFTEDELKRLDIWDSDQWEIEELEE